MDVDRPHSSIWRSAATSHLTLDHIWLVVPVALSWFLISLLPLPPNDLWWHMAAGRTMLAEGAWLTENRWAYTLPASAPYIYQSWLSEVLLYGIWQVGDVPLLALARTLAICASYGLLGWHALRRSRSGRAVALALLVAVLIGWNNWTLRPQTLALLPGAAFAVVLGEYLDRRLAARWLGLLPLLMVLWVNMHGSFVLGLVLLGLAWLGNLWDALATRRPPAMDQLSVSARQAPPPKTQNAELNTLTLTLLASIGAAMLHPLGPAIFPYLTMMVGNPALQEYFVEWQPPVATLNPLDTGMWFFLMLLGLALLLARSPRRPTTTELLWYAALSWLTIGGVRYAMWYALLLLPLLAAQIAGLLRPRPAVQLSMAGSALFGLLLAIMVLATLPWLTPGRYLGAGASNLFAASGPGHLLLSKTTPLAATAWLEAHPINGRFWVDMSYSSYTIWRLPDKQVFADLRAELFPLAIWQDYFAIAKGNQHSLEALERWQITHLMTHNAWQAALNQLLAATPGWCERYNDGTSSIWARCQ